MASRRATDKIGVDLISSMCVILSFSEESEIRFASAWSGVETPGWRLVTSVLGIVYCVGSSRCSCSDASPRGMTIRYGFFDF